MQTTLCALGFVHSNSHSNNKTSHSLCKLVPFSVFKIWIQKFAHELWAQCKSTYFKCKWYKLQKFFRWVEARLIPKGDGTKYNQNTHLIVLGSWSQCNALFALWSWTFPVSRYSCKAVRKPSFRSRLFLGIYLLQRLSGLWDKLKTTLLVGLLSRTHPCNHKRTWQNSILTIHLI